MTNKEKPWVFVGFTIRMGGRVHLNWLKFFTFLNEEKWKFGRWDEEQEGFNR